MGAEMNGDREYPDESTLTVRGYRFLIPEDAEAAKTDLDRIEHLNRYLKGARGANILPLYEKSIHNRIFATPVGWEYLQELRGMLIDQGVDPETLPSIEIGVPITRRRLPGDYRAKEIVAETPPPPKSLSLKTSIFLNIVLVLLVILMFVIAFTSRTDNILNYRHNVINNYSSWAEELSERKKKVREKERELSITRDSDQEEQTDVREDADGQTEDSGR